jgi:ABC-type sugar transport system permease subunit
MVTPAFAVIAIVVVFPLLWTFWESLHLHDFRMPWLGTPFIGAANYVEAFADGRFRGALGRTAVFVAVTVSLEIVIGLLLALYLESVTRFRAIIRTAVLLPWAIPTVVAALIWRFVFESPNGVASAVLTRLGLMPPTWFADPLAAWMPLVVADVWKTAPFVALLLLAGLQAIDRSLYEAAAIDGATPWRQFTDITLPLLRPAMTVALLFRALDAFRVFDIVFVMTAGGPGTATEPIALYTYSSLMQNLRFGFGSALSVIIFAVAFLFALGTIRMAGGFASRELAA